MVLEATFGTTKDGKSRENFGTPNHDSGFEDDEMDYEDAMGMRGKIGGKNDMDIETPKDSQT